MSNHDPQQSPRVPEALGPDLASTLRHHGDRPWGAPGTDPGNWSPPPAGLDADLHGFTVCFHVDAPGLLVETTTSSMITELPADSEAPLRAWVALGTPCASLYLPIFPPADVAPALAQRSTWARFAALRNRVETDTEALGEVRAVLGPLETELWQRAEVDATDTDPAARAVGVTEAWTSVDAALVRLGV